VPWVVGCVEKACLTDQSYIYYLSLWSVMSKLSPTLVILGAPFLYGLLALRGAAVGE